MAAPPSGPSSGPHRATALRRNAALIISFLLVVGGLAITMGSLSTQYLANYEMSYAGTIAPGNQTLVLPQVGVGYIQVNLTEGGCALRVYPATDVEWNQFNGTGILPATWIDCEHRMATTTGDVRNLILVDSGSSEEPYNVTVLAYSIETPYGWLALPGAVMALAGLLVLVPRLVMERTTRLRDEFDGKKEKDK